MNLSNLQVLQFPVELAPNTSINNFFIYFEGCLAAVIFQYTCLQTYPISSKIFIGERQLQQ